MQDQEENETGRSILETGTSPWSPHSSGGNGQQLMTSPKHICAAGWLLSPPRLHKCKYLRAAPLPAGKPSRGIQHQVSLGAAPGPGSEKPRLHGREAESCFTYMLRLYYPSTPSGEHKAAVGWNCRGGFFLLQAQWQSVFVKVECCSALR